MQVTFLEKQYTTPTDKYYQKYDNEALFRSNETSLLIGIKSNLITFYLAINYNNKRPEYILSVTSPSLDCSTIKNKNIVQKALDESTKKFLIKIEKQINFHNKIVEDYKKFLTDFVILFR
jgi:hypothetical protein